MLRIARQKCALDNAFALIEGHPAGLAKSPLAQLIISRLRTEDGSGVRSTGPAASVVAGQDSLRHPGSAVRAEHFAVVVAAVVVAVVDSAAPRLVTEAGSESSASHHDRWWDRK